MKGFRKILNYFPTHWKYEKHWGYYLSVFFFIAISLAVNYFSLTHTTLERAYIWKFSNQGWGVPAYFLFYGFPYFFVTFLYVAWHKQWHIFKSRDFWVRSLSMLVILSLDAAWMLYRHAPEWASVPADQYFLRKVTANLQSTLSTGFLVMLYYWWKDRKKGHAYGLRIKGFEAGPYWILLGLMAPIVLSASFLPDFIAYYPTLKMKSMAGLTLMPEWAAYACYEFAYLSDFLWTELAFRGLLVIGMAETLGVGAVLPAAATYCYIHFAKPFGEAASSVFGGYILGVIALNSRNIWGGVMVHLGIAALMEIFALLQHFLR